MDLMIDDTTPSDRIMLTQKQDELILQHGGTASCIKYKSLTVMGLDDFLANEAPALKEARDTVTVIRDTASSRNYLLYGDTAVRYDGCDVEDVELDRLWDKLRVESDKIWLPNSTFPLVSWVEKPRQGLRKIVVRMPPMAHPFTDKRLGLQTTLWLPQLWFGVMMTTGKDIRQLSVAVVQDNVPNCLSAKLKRLPLPNIYTTGKICTGSSRVSVALEDDPTEDSIVMLCINRFFNSGWNTDLLNDDYAAVLGGEDFPVYTAVAGADPEVKSKFDKLISKHTGTPQICGQLRVLAVLSVPFGYAQCQFQPLQGTAESFVQPGEM